MDLNDISLFVRVAELKSFVRAAAELRMEPSSLSRKISRLEAALGVRLLQRTTRRVSLTEEGARFLAETASGLELVHSAVDSLHSLHGAPQGKVRVTSAIDIGQFLVEYVMPDFYPTFPDIQIEWDLLGAHRNLVDSAFDLAIRPMHSPEQSVIEKKIGRLSTRIFRSPQLELPTLKRPSVEELERLPWVVFSRGPLDMQRAKLSVMIDGVETEIHPRNARFRINSLVSIASAITKGLGVGLLPSPISAPELAAGTIVPVLPGYLEGTGVDFFAVYPSKEYLSPKVRVLIDWLCAKFPSDPTKGVRSVLRRSR